MASATMTAGLKTSALLSSRLEAKSLKATPTSQSFSLKAVNAKVSCSAEESVRSFVKKVADASKAAAIAVASSALIATAAQAEAPRLSFDELQTRTYSEIKGTGIANQCPDVLGGVDGLGFKAGKYNMTKFCMEPTSFTVKTEKVSRAEGTTTEFTKTKLMTRLTYTLDEMEGPFEIGSDGSVKFTEVDGIDYAAVTVQLPGGERVPFLFTVKELVASGPASNITGEYTVPSYRGATFLDPKGRGGTTGYDNAVALPAGGRGDEEELAKENDKSYKPLSGKIALSVTKSDPSTGEISGTFVSVQPSDTDMGAKVPKDVRIEGIWYAQLD